MFKRFFKPKWQHINADIRREAVTKLDGENKDEYQILKDLAQNDESIDVRCAAIERMGDVSDLLALLGNTKDAPTLEDSLNHRISVLLCMSLDTPLAFKLSVLEQVNEPSVFRYVVKNGQQVDLQVAAAEQITDEETLEQLALHAQSVKVRQKAVEKISSPSHLKLIEQVSRAKDKSVYKIARDKLAGQKEQLEQHQQEVHEAKQVLVAIEKLSSSAVEPLYAHKLQRIVMQWSELPTEQRQQLELRWLRALAACEQALQEWQNNDFSDDVVSAENSIEEQQAALIVLRDVLQLVESERELLQLDLPALQGVLTTQLVRWENAIQYVEPSFEDVKQFDHLNKEIKQYIEPTRQLKNLAGKIESALSEVVDVDSLSYQGLKQSIKTISQLDRALNWPENFPEHALVRSLRQSLTKLKQTLDSMNQQSKAESDAIKVMLTDLEAVLDQGMVKRSQKLLNQVQGKLKRVETSKAQQFDAALKRLQGKFRELRDWQGYATTPKKEALLEAMQALASTDMLPPDKAVRIKELQDSWKALGSAERERELWLAFKAAGDKAFEPCRTYFKAQGVKRAEHLAQRIQLCEQLEAYEQNNDWGRADWPVVLETIITAKTAWRSFFPVESKPNKPVQQRFNDITHQIQKRLDEERNRNSRLKENLIERATALIDKEDLEDAIHRVKSLQKEWKSIGITHRKTDDAQWKSFRTVCNTLFARRTSEKEVDQAARLAHQKQFEAACERFERITQLDDEVVFEKKGEVKSIQAEIDSIGALPVNGAKQLRAHFKRLQMAASEKIERASAIKIEQGYQLMWDKAALCHALESKLLEKNLMDSDLAEIKENWMRLGDLPIGAETALNARFDLAISIIGQDEDAFEKYRSTTTKNGQLCRALAIQSEVLAGVDSPEEDHELRMQLQVKRLSSGMQSSISSKEQQADSQRYGQRHELEIEWCSNGPVNDIDMELYEARFKSSLLKL